MSNFEKEFLIIAIGQFKHFKERAEKGIQQLSEKEFHWKPSEESNNIAIIIKHLSGNMHSRWVDFLTTDGEKSYRDRDLEFVDDNESKEHLMQIWEEGWKLLFNTIENLKAEDLYKTVTLRQQPLSVLQAIQNEVAHISYHLGQILYIGKQIKDKEWTILSIPKNRSKEFNEMVSVKR
ncbi:DUF1572 domain-containing protein [Cytobacillus depressus]|uniref:DUF1572 domain-containing protein n=1 Tax=Cytobacillus depressus TaxID=1602942 RepID=A0A6L3V4Y0_9BACI|nr:DUF1572 family protein [Cytobacillus depressus]KAB2334429.1 DUF1572 domain-containing protein [Cytobacillus depressus]